MRVLVTGGGGFLGSGIAQSLNKNNYDVSILGRHNYLHLPKSIRTFQGDIRDFDFLLKVFSNVDTVFHTAAFPGIWGRKEDFHTINVDGTRNVIKACLLAGVKKLVFTSSPSVIYGGSSLEGVDETVPYPDRYMCEYSRSKAIAEMLVIDANGEDLATVSIRPHLIWGPGDPHLVPRILAKSDSGRLIRVGRGDNKVDIIYIDNAVSAHLKAWDALEIGNRLAGKVYFVSDGEPVKLWDWIDNLLIKTGRPPVSRSISYRTAVKLGHFFEGLYNFCGIKVEPPITRFMASQLATSHYFNITRARNDFGYEPVISPDEGLSRLIQTVPVKC